MDDNSAELKTRRVSPRWPVTMAAKHSSRKPLPRGLRVYWGPTDHEAIGTVTSDAPDRDGLIEVSWDGIGTYKENPANLRPANS